MIIGQGLYGILRTVTRIVKVYPFLYAILLVACILCGMFCSEELATTLDTLFYVSPIVVLLLFRLSYALKLCNWHRAQCLLPTIPAMFGYLDYLFLDFNSYTFEANTVAIIVLILASLINAYNMFIKPKQ